MFCLQLKLFKYNRPKRNKKPTGEVKMKIFIVTADHIKGHKFIANVGNKLDCSGTKSREKAEQIAKKWNGEIFSLLVEDTLRLVSKEADNKIYKEAKRIGAI